MLFPLITELQQELSKVEHRGFEFLTALIAIIEKSVDSQVVNNTVSVADKMDDQVARECKLKHLKTVLQVYTNASYAQSCISNLCKYYFIIFANLYKYKLASGIHEFLLEHLVSK
jgi:hypothetical protein